jgi:hypothetical protein
MYHSVHFRGRIFSPMSCHPNRVGTFSKCFMTTPIAYLTSSASSQQPANNAWSPSTRQKEYWHILHGINCKLKLNHMGFIPIRVHMKQGCVSVGIIPIKHEVKEKASQALFSFIPWYPASNTGKNKKLYEMGVCAFRNTEWPPEGHSAFSHTYHTMEERI